MFIEMIEKELPPPKLPRLKIMITGEELLDLLTKHTLCEPFEIQIPNLGWVDIEVILNLERIR